MFRQLALVAALMLTAVACQNGAPHHPASASAGGPQAEKLARLRDTDVCALLPRAELAKLGSVTAVGTDYLYKCTAGFGADRSTIAQVQWIVQALDIPKLDKGTAVTIDGMPVSLIGDNDVLSPAEITSTSVRSCHAYAQLPTGGSLELTITSLPGIEPCPVAQTLVTVALSEWKRHPRLGDSPDTVRTSVTGADPCAVLAKLPGAVEGNTQWVDRCWFELDGDSMYVEYRHASDREFENYRPVNVAGHPAYRTSKKAGASFMIRVGPTFDPVADGSEFADVPAVLISGRNDATMEKVTAAVLTLFPNVE